MKTINYEKLNLIAEKNSIVLFGGTTDKMIPVTELAQSYELESKLYNRSIPGLSITDAKDAFVQNVASIQPEAVLIHLGEEDAILFKNNSSEFDNSYINLIEEAKKTNPKIRIGLVSLYNSEENQTIADMNRHIKAIADSERVDFINLDNVKDWNPRAMKDVLSFVHALGLNVKKPLRDVAEIVFNYVYENFYSMESDLSA